MLIASEAAILFLIYYFLTSQSQLDYNTATKAIKDSCLGCVENGLQEKLMKRACVDCFWESELFLHVLFPIESVSLTLQHNYKNNKRQWVALVARKKDLQE